MCMKERKLLGPSEAISDFDGFTLVSCFMRTVSLGNSVLVSHVKDEIFYQRRHAVGR